MIIHHKRLFFQEASPKIKKFQHPFLKKNKIFQKRLILKRFKKGHKNRDFPKQSPIKMNLPLFSKTKK